jgi:hypothetical protein
MRIVCVTIEGREIDNGSEVRVELSGRASSKDIRDLYDLIGQDASFVMKRTPWWRRKRAMVKPCN